MFGITKLDYSRCVKGWQVRLAYTSRTPAIQKVFPVYAYGYSWSKALRAAKAYRDNQLQILKENGIPLGSVKYYITVSSRNTTGIVGVHKRYQTTKVNNIPTQSNTIAWVATWSEKGKAKSRSFSEGKYGPEAKRLAIQAREQAVERIKRVENIK
jgi:hypothetical protein